LQRDLEDLHKHAAHEEYYASKDGQGELQERRAEYARKEEHLLRAYKRKVASTRTAQADHGAQGSGVDTSASPAFFLASESSKDSSTWQKDLTSKQQRELQRDLEDLHKHAAHEEYYASKDGQGELQQRRAEYARKEEHLLRAYKRKAASAHAAQAQHDAQGHSVDTSATPAVFLASQPGVESTLSRQGASNTTQSWQEKLSIEQRRELHKKLSHLEKENRVQTTYASEYGPQALKSQQKEYERKVARVLADFNRTVSAGNVTLFAMGTSAGGSAKLVGLCAFAMSGLVMTFAFIKRNVLRRPGLTEPLLMMP